MGYTHYWTIKSGTIKSGTKEQMMSSLSKILTNHLDIIREEYDSNNAPILNSKYIRFNGIQDNGCETLFLEFKKSSNYTKTNRLDYDLPVCECLLIIKAHLQNNMILSSDGFSLYQNQQYDGSWELAIQNVSKLGYSVDYKIYPRPNTPFFDAKVNVTPPKVN